MYGFGPDPMMEALQAAIQPAQARLAEIAATGFDTNAAFDIAWMRQREGQRVQITSLGTQTAYEVVLLPGTGDDNHMHCALVVIGANTLRSDQYRKLTIARGDRGQMVVHPGWVSPRR